MFRKAPRMTVKFFPCPRFIKYSIGFRASTGRTFNWSYADYVGGSFSARMNLPSIDGSFKDQGGEEGQG